VVKENIMNEKVASFQQKIWSYYREQGRSFAWRDEITPYRVFVSEVMLQQTQTQRVAQKFEPFLEAFPSFEALAQAPQAEVLRMWQGLGYNRRALGLYRSAQIIVNEHAGVLPNDPVVLQTLPGIGPATAASLCAFAYNVPTVFIETNVRAVFLHHFFPQQGDVSDKQLLPLVQEALDNNNPREWYYALMDYGVMLKKTLPNPSRKSKHHTIQSKFEGSERQIRGMILKFLTESGKASYSELCEVVGRDQERVKRNLEALCKEGFIQNDDQIYFL
jgi:A/G-specific adenine glycosylase